MLKFQPQEGSVIYCDFTGFIVPEIIKKRPVVVVYKHRHNSKLLCVVPISTTAPDPIRDYHIEMDSLFCDKHLDGRRSWIKCDIINTVSLERLNLVRDKKLGTRNAPNVGDVMLQKIKIAIRRELNL